MVRTKTRADDKQANSVAIRALADAHRRLTPPRIGWRTPEPAQVTTSLKNCSGGYVQNPRCKTAAARAASGNFVRRRLNFSKKEFLVRGE